jgi:hypothetical protein
MEWLLVISVIINIVLALLTGFFAVLKMRSDNEAFHATQEWKRWEERFYEAQGKALDEHGLFISPTMGEFGKMVIKKHNRG